jgi:ATP-dependent Clp protease ATP-binding subunit ClpB
MDLQLQLDEGVLDKLAQLGFDPVYGARPLKRAIQQWLENPLAQEVLKGTYPPGSTVVVSLIGQDIAFSKKVRAT